MFCQTCGKNLADDAKFCDVCGTAVATNGAPAPVAVAAPPAQPVQPVQPGQPVQVVQIVRAPNPMVTNFVATIKNFWGNPIATVGTAAKSTTHEWVLLAVMGIVLYALGTAVVGLEMLTQLLKSIMGSLAGGLGLSKMYPFWAILGIGLLVGAVAFFGTALGLWILVAKVFKKSASFVQVLNMVGAATLPLTAIHLVNMLVGLVFSPLTVVLFAAVFAMVAVCLYTGIQKLDKLDKSPFYGYSVVIAVVTLATCLLGMLYISAIGDGITSFATSSIGSLLGGSSSLFNMF